MCVGMFDGFGLKEQLQGMLHACETNYIRRIAGVKRVEKRGMNVQRE